jgi:hypothetical protein
VYPPIYGWLALPTLPYNLHQIWVGAPEHCAVSPPAVMNNENLPFHQASWPCLHGMLVLSGASPKSFAMRGRQYSLTGQTKKVKCRIYLVRLQRLPKFLPCLLHLSSSSTKNLECFHSRNPTGNVNPFICRGIAQHPLWMKSLAAILRTEKEFYSLQQQVMGEVSVFGQTMTRPNVGLLSHKFHHVHCRRILESNSYTSRVALTCGEILAQHFHYRVSYTHFPQESEYQSSYTTILQHYKCQQTYKLQLRFIFPARA